jgi:putative ABC transport system permease protein
MLLHYFKLALRHLRKNRGFSAINITGLSIGIAVSIVGFLFVGHELSYDRFHDNADRIVRIAVDALVGNTEIRQLHTPAPMAQALYDEFPEVEEVCRITPTSYARIIIDDKIFKEDDVLMVDSTFFRMFSFPLLNGEKENVLNQPNAVVLSENTALKYFGHLDVVGELIKYRHRNTDTTYLLNVTGVMKDFPENSHFHAEVLVSILTFDGLYNNPAWFSNFNRTYILLKENADYRVLDTKMPEFVDKYLFEGSYQERIAGTNNKWELHLQPLLDIHLNSNFRGEFKANGKKEYVYIFLIAAVFILLLAVVNFVNLSTAKSASRAREVGIRKVLGSGKPRLFSQFMGESFLYSVVSLIIGLVFMELILEMIREVFNIHMVMPYFSSPFTIPALLVGGLLLGLLSGFYPALVLSNFSPMFALKDTSLRGKKSPWLRNVLVVFQFAVSVVLIFGTIIIFLQMRLLQNEDLGFDKSNILIIQHATALDPNQESFKAELLQLPFVESVSISNRLPGHQFNNLGFRADDFEDTFTLNICGCDEGYDDVLKLNILDGRFFSPEYGTDSTSTILNQEAVKLLGWEEPIGKKVYDLGPNQTGYTVIGVIEDLYYESKHHSIQPMALMNLRSPFGFVPSYVSVRLNQENMAEIILEISQVWDSFSPGLSFDYTMLASEYDRLYINEQQTQSLFIAFSILAVFIACLGLLGLSSFMLEQQTREIGVRKVFGATAPNISLMFIGRFMRWVIIANIIGWPIAWYVMDNWLQNFQYRVALTWWVFIAAAMITVFVALLTTLYESLKAAQSNPIKTLRHN